MRRYEAGAGATSTALDQDMDAIGGDTDGE